MLENNKIVVDNVRDIPRGYEGDVILKSYYAGRECHESYIRSEDGTIFRDDMG